MQIMLPLNISDIPQYLMMVLDSSTFALPSQNNGHSWNHFSLLQTECTERLWPKSTYLPIVKPTEFSYDKMVPPVAFGSPTTFAVRTSSRKQ
jgi:hypothetical protein